MADSRTEAGELGYGPSWLDAGVLTPMKLSAQLEHFRGPDGDPNLEHYRAATLADYLADRPSLPDSQVDLLLDLARSELPGPLHGHVFHSLVKHPGLTDEQFHKVTQAWDEPGFASLALREELLRSRARDPRSEAVLDRAQREGDSVVHAALLGADLPISRLRWLMECGATRAIRNRAAAELRRRHAPARRDDRRRAAELRSRFESVFPGCHIRVERGGDGIESSTWFDIEYEGRAWVVECQPRHGFGLMSMAIRNRRKLTGVR